MQRGLAPRASGSLPHMPSQPCYHMLEGFPALRSHIDGGELLPQVLADVGQTVVDMVLKDIAVSW